jgi:glutathione-regulated potassium-efflux system ancillary protein KefG
MSRRVRPEDLIEAQTVAEILGLRQRNSVSTYQARYSDMPRPVVNLANGKIRLWLRSEVERWDRTRERAGRREVASRR